MLICFFTNTLYESVCYVVISVCSTVCMSVHRWQCSQQNLIQVQICTSLYCLLCSPVYYQQERES